MSKTLILAEKPSVMRDIATALASTHGPFTRGQGYLESPTLVISSGIGHLVELTTPLAVSGATLPILPPAFELQPIDRTKDQYALVKKLIARPDITSLVNACDAGREGELIFRLIYELSSTKKPMTRMWLQSMTQQAIIDSFNTMKPGSHYDNLAAAARSRAEADWLVGINGSRSVSKAFNKSMNVGRVMTPTLAMIVHRALEIQSFKPVAYGEIHGKFGVSAGEYVGKWQNPNPAEGDPPERCMSAPQAKSILEKCLGKAPTSVTEESKSLIQASPKLFDLTTLQREANKRFGLSAKETLDIAQSLYETHKALTYPRTDSSALPEDYVQKAKETVQALAGKDYAAFAKSIVENDWVKPVKRIFDNSKISDHFAIIPTGSLPQSLSPAEAKVYDLVVRRFLAVFYPSAEFTVTTRITTVESERFKSTGRVLVNEGWLAVYGKEVDEDEEPALCKYVQGEAVRPVSMDIKSLKTKPPKLYTEATLLAAMESAGKFVEDEELSAALKEKGIGTPATRAATIEKLLENKTSKGDPKEAYVVRDKKNLVPTPLGVKLVQFLEANKIALTSPESTGELEQKLALVEKGSFPRKAFMSEIEQLATDTVRTIGAQAAQAMAKLKAPCPKCSGVLAIDPRTVSCTTGCGFKIWRVICTRVLSEAECEQLTETKLIGPLDGFTSAKSDNKFSAKLQLEADGSTNFIFEERPTQPLSYKCPKCRGDLADSHASVSCKCGFTLWKTVAKRQLTPGECQILVTRGQVGPLNGLISSKTGKAFSATLTLDRDFRVSFQF